MRYRSRVLCFRKLESSRFQMLLMLGTHCRAQEQKVALLNPLCEQPFIANSPASGPWINRDRKRKKGNHMPDALSDAKAALDKATKTFTSLAPSPPAGTPV